MNFCWLLMENFQISIQLQNERHDDDDEINLVHLVDADLVK